jgi:uncharacterized protein
MIEEVQYAGNLIDASVHNDLEFASDLWPFLDSEWRHYLESIVPDGDFLVLLEDEYRRPATDVLQGVAPSTGMVDPSHFATNLAANVRHVILNQDSMLRVSKLPHPQLADALARAANDWLIAEWLPVDGRFAGSIVVANQIPEQAAAEIRRVGEDERMVQVAMGSNGVGHAYGHPQFDPIYRAASELGLPVAVHSGSHGGVNPSPTAGGRASYYLEHEMLGMQAMTTCVASLIAGGTFEKFPDLKIVLQGGGVAWLPAFFWRFESDYRGLRREIPWAKHTPLEYLTNNIVVSTESLERIHSDEHLFPALADIGAPHALLYASDFPRPGSQASDELAARIPQEWHARVFHDNAARVFPRLAVSIEKEPRHV